MQSNDSIIPRIGNFGADAENKHIIRTPHPPIGHLTYILWVE